MNLKTLSLAAAISIGILTANSAVNAAQSHQNTNLLCDMGSTGYAAPIVSATCKCPKKHKLNKYKKLSHKAKPITGAAAPISRPEPSCAAPCPAPCNPCQPAPCNPCPEPCNPCPAPCPTGSASPIQPCAPCDPCPAPCPVPCNPCPAPCNPCQQSQ